MSVSEPFPLFFVGRTGNRVIEGLLGKMASLVRSVEDLVVKDGEVEGKAEADGVGWGELGLGNLGGSLVGIEGLVGRVLALVPNSEFGQVSVIVTLPVADIRAWTTKTCVFVCISSSGAYILW